MDSLKLIFSDRRYFAPVWVFASLNIMISTWVIYIPHVKSSLDLNDGQLGVALFFLSLGTLAMIPFAPRIIRVLKVGPSTLIGIILFSLFFILPLSAPTYVLLCAALFLTGLGASLTDISMNSLITEVERSDNVHFMSAAHGFFSLGGVIGAGLGSLVILLFNSPVTHMAFTAGGVIITNLILSLRYMNVESLGSSLESKKMSRYSLFKPLFGLAIIAFLVMGGEGSVEHWSKLFMQDMAHVESDRLSGLAFVVFSATMTLGRFMGDQWSRQFGSINLILFGCIVAAIGFGFVLDSSLISSTFGFGLVGLGFSVVIPELFRISGKIKGIESARGISFVAGVGYVGFLLSPPILGFLSNMEDLGLSFLVLLGSILLSIILILVLRKRINSLISGN